MSKFITLTKFGGNEILINPFMIQAIEPTAVPQAKSIVYMMAGTSWMVMETMDDIIKKIRASESMTIINYDPKKP